MAYSTPLRKPLQPGQVSPIISKTLRFRYSHMMSRSLFVWAFVNAAISLMLFGESQTKFLQMQLIGDSDVVQFCVAGLSIIFAVNSVIDFIQALQPTFPKRSLALSPLQKRLLGIKQTDPGYEQPVSELSLPPHPSPAVRQPFNLSAMTSSTPSQRTSLNPLSNSPHISPLHAGRNISPSSNISGNLSLNTPGKLANQSGSYFPVQRRVSPPVQGSPVGVAAALDGSSYLDSSSGAGASPFLRHRMSPFRASPLSPDEFMVDQRTLNCYLRSHYEKEQARANIVALDTSYGSSPGTWSYSRLISPLDASQEMLKNQYQIATASPKSPTSRKDEKDDATKFATLEYWRKHGIGSELLTEWTVRLRRWIAVTLLARIVSEIDKINNKLKKLGCPEIQVGESSVSALKQILGSKGNQIPNLTRLLPYLEVANNQEYLVARLKQLASGGYMSEFRWNAGGEVKGRKWADDLPTDCDILIHVFCVYMDSHLPADPRYPDGKTFTSKYFVRTPDKPKPMTSGKLILHQSKINSPHFRLITEETLYNISPGRNNFFHALLLFLHHVKTKKDGMLGQVSLGASGINVLQIMDS